jgi:hypothetical protein
MIRFALPALLIALPAAAADVGPRPLTVTRGARCPLM